MEYRSVSDVLKETYGQKIYRLSLQSGCSCPNRDGTLGTGGCTFCSNGGSGEFASPLLPVEEQIRLAKQRVDQKIPFSIPAENRLYIAYFQSYTNTYGDVKRLRSLYQETIRRPEICILSVGTRPDCLGSDQIRMLRELNRVKPVWVELGLQTASDQTAQRIHRGYALKVFDDAYRRLKEAGLTVIVHVILGLPDENEADMLQTVRHVSDLFWRYQVGCSEGIRTDGIKLQLLHVLRGTQLAREYQEKPFHILTLEEYSRIVISCLKLLPEEMVIHRLTGDGPKALLIAPLWSADKKKVLNTLNAAIRNTDRE